MFAQLVRFKRFDNSNWESGIAFGMSGVNSYDPKNILDEHGHFVGVDLYDYNLVQNGVNGAAIALDTENIL